MREGWELKLLLVLLLGTSLIACDSTPSCVVGHLATKSYSKPKVDNKYKAKKVSLKKKSSYKSKPSKRK